MPPTIEKPKAIAWQPGMTLRNANGDVSASTLGYQYAIQTTSFVRPQIIQQKYYEIPPAEFVPIVIGTGAWMEAIQTNIVMDVAGDFESGVISVADPSRIAQVSAGLTTQLAKIVTWAKGYQYSTPEMEKALASNNWDVVAAKMAALKRNWDLGIQKIAFLGAKFDPTNVPGLLSNAAVNVSTAVITAAIGSLTAAQFSTFIGSLLEDYFANSKFTVMPNTLVMPMSDYLSLGVPVASGFPNVSMLTYLEDMLKRMTQQPGFIIRGLAYCNKAQNAGYWASGGTNRYMLYRKDPETLRMDIPVDFMLNAPGTSNNFNWEGVAAGQFTGTIIYRPAECRYYDWG
jgi:hypothetical protein